MQFAMRFAYRILVQKTDDDNSIARLSLTASSDQLPYFQNDRTLVISHCRTWICWVSQGMTNVNHMTMIPHRETIMTCYEKDDNLSRTMLQAFIQPTKRCEPSECTSSNRPTGMYTSRGRMRQTWHFGGGASPINKSQISAERQAPCNEWWF